MGKRKTTPPKHRCIECLAPVHEKDWGQSMRCPVCARKLREIVSQQLEQQAPLDQQQQSTEH